jgi:hypothetical protein
MIGFNSRYLMLALLLLATEVLIALYLHDSLIRPYGGDVLVVMLIYCTVKAFLNTPPSATGLAVLAFAFVIEFMQYFNLVTLLGLQHNKVARVVLGTSFSVADLGCYTLGIIFILLAENTLNHGSTLKK